MIDYGLWVGRQAGHLVCIKSSSQQQMKLGLGLPESNSLVKQKLAVLVCNITNTASISRSKTVML